MLYNYLIIALRNAWKNKLNTIINLSGLTIGLASFILIFLYIRYELSYDTHFDDAHQIYRVSQIHRGDVFKGSDRSAVSPAPLGPTLKTEFPEVKASTTLDFHEGLLSAGGANHSTTGLYADECLFEVFSFKMIEGTGKDALQDPSTIILSQSLAKKYFGEESPIGKTILFQKDIPLRIIGIVEDQPMNQHFDFNYITSWKNLPYYDEEKVWYSNTSWYSHNYYTYLKLKENIDQSLVERKLSFLDNRYDADKFPGGIKPEWFFQPLERIHLYSKINEEIQTNNDIRYIYLFASIGLIILLLATINYVNINTAQSSQRAREVGVRKVLGSGKQQLLWQFLSESFLFTVTSLLIALFVVKGMLPIFKQLLGIPLIDQFLLDGPFWILVTLLVFLVGILAGWYPALVLSTSNPINALKGGFLKQFSLGIPMRNVLIVGQFIAAIILAVGSLVIYQQLQFIQQKKLGYNREGIIYIPYQGGEYFPKTEVIRAELLKHPQINKVSFTAYLPLDQDSQTTVDEWFENKEKASISIYRNYIDANFIDLFEMELVEGKGFQAINASDSISSYILNESALEALGWTSAINKPFHGGKVVGVVKDFHFQPFDLRIEPMYMALRERKNSRKGNIAIKLNQQNISATLTDIQQTLQSIVPGNPFSYHFMDESYNQLYRAEQKISRVLNVFTLLALFIACIGLFGLVMNHVLQRTKEIGIRKVLGASILSIIHLLTKDFLKLVGLAAIIAFPIAWWGTNQWLKEFVYRIHFGWHTFVVAGGLVLVLATLTVALLGLSAATSNPIESLRDE